jgi:hypothetical protein
MDWHERQMAELKSALSVTYVPLGHGVPLPVRDEALAHPGFSYELIVELSCFSKYVSLG